MTPFAPAVLATIDPQDQATTDKTSDWASVAKYPYVMMIALIGNTTGTQDFKLQQATDGSGTGAKDITGAAITQLGAGDDNKQAIILMNCKDNLDIENGFTFVGIVNNVTGGTANLLAAVLLGLNGRYEPVDAHDLSSVAEIVVL